MATYNGTSGDDTWHGTSSSDYIDGKAGNDTLYGEGGDDTIDGGTGDDHLYGNAGQDLLRGGDGNDTVDGGDGNDTLIDSFGNDTLYGGLGFDALYGNDGDDVVYGGADKDIVSGGAGLDLLDGGTGADEMYGGTGNDIYYVDNAGDGVFEQYSTIDGTDPLDANDKVYSTISYTLGARLESLTLLGIANINGTGNAANNNIFGNNGNNILVGGNGNDYLYAAAGNDTLNGGVGNDTLEGGVGNDTYYIDTPNDTAYEYAGEGTDTIFSSYNYTLLANFENLTLTGSAANGTGNSSANIITGNDAANILSGGAGNDYLYGAQGNDVLDGGVGGDTLEGGLGDDTYYVDSNNDAVYEYYNEGTDTVYSAYNYSLLTNFENLTLTGTAVSGVGNNLNNMIYGNDNNNTIYGGDGTDQLFGGNGSDLLSGEAGNDTLNGDAGRDKLFGGAGDDTYYVDDPYDLAIEYQEDAQFVEHGHYEQVHSTREYYDSYYMGRLYTDDNSYYNYEQTYFYNNGGYWAEGYEPSGPYYEDIYTDQWVVDYAGYEYQDIDQGGYDTVFSAVDYSLSSPYRYAYTHDISLEERSLYSGRYIEALILTGTANIHATGNGLDNLLQGNSGNNTLSGLNGNDVLDGKAGADQMEGGLGNDTYYVDNTGDKVIEKSGEGTDTVYSSVSFSIASLFVENLTLLGAANINATGNDSYNNTLFGNSGNNTLDGKAGADRMEGGLGNDNYFVDNTGDKVIEKSGEGTDTVYSSVSFSIANQFVENLRLSGSANINATGNDMYNNNLFGNDGNNILDGRAGADRMEGGLGNDSYFVDDAGDRVIEKSGEGTDTVYSTVSFSIASQYVENLRLSGSANINATGNDTYNNTLFGNSGNNVLDGKGGNDRFTGSGGMDTAIYHTLSATDARGGNGADVWSDFTVGNTSTNTNADKIDIGDLLIGYSGNGSLASLDPYLSVTASGGKSSFYVDRDGAGSAYRDTLLLTLSGVTTSLSELVSNQQIVV